MHQAAWAFCSLNVSFHGYFHQPTNRHQGRVELCSSYTTPTPVKRSTTPLSTSTSNPPVFRQRPLDHNSGHAIIGSLVGFHQYVLISSGSSDRAFAELAGANYVSFPQSLRSLLTQPEHRHDYTKPRARPETARDVRLRRTFHN